MKKFIVILLFVVINANAGENIRFLNNYSLCNKKEQSYFILECIKNANPKSDEEPEDWIYMCKDMSLDLFCESTKTAVYYTYGTTFGDEISCECSQCEDKKAIQYCNARGWKTK